MELFAKTVKNEKPFTIFAKTSTLDVWQGPEYASQLDVSFLNELKGRLTFAASKVLFAYLHLPSAEPYSEHLQTSKMECFAHPVNDFKLLNVYAKTFPGRCLK